MSTTFSDHWYRVAALHPRLRSHVQIDRHCYRGEIWHLLKDPVSGRIHRLNEQGWGLVARMDGRLSMHEIWTLVLAEAGNDAPTQPEAIALLAQLHEGELIQTEAAPDIGRLFERAGERRTRATRQRLNPLALRVGLVDPTRLLDAAMPLVRPLLHGATLCAWLALVLVALALLAPHGGELRAYAMQQLATPRMLLVLWCVYPAIKLVHEFAHALAVRAWGGEVHDMGFSLLLLMPVPYVDASAAAGFRERHRRVLVSLMGILAETTLAALGVLAWLSFADGVLREVAFATVLVGGVSTLLFNGNPLLRFDAYHALADAIDSPGLATRGSAYWRYLARRHLLGVAQATPPTVARGERRWLVGYSLASGVYRVFVMLAIIGWLLGVHLLLGVAAAAWWLAVTLGRPAWRLVAYCARDAELAGRRGRAAVLATLAIGVPLLLLLGVPVPDGTRAEGVVWAPPHTQVRTEGEGFVAAVLVADGDAVVVGQPVLRLHDPALLAEIEVVTARLRGLDTAYQATLFDDTAKANGVAEQLRRAEAELARLQARLAALEVRSSFAGRIAIDHAQDLPGRFLARGTQVAQVLGADDALVRVVIAEDDVARVHQAGGAIAVRLADAPNATLTARLQAMTPAAMRELPSAALGDRGGGSVVTDPADPQGLRPLQPQFALDLSLPGRALQRVGTRAWVRFDHGARPLGAQWLVRVRQLLLRQTASNASGPWRT